MCSNSTVWEKRRTSFDQAKFRHFLMNHLSLALFKQNQIFQSLLVIFLYKFFYQIKFNSPKTKPTSYHRFRKFEIKIYAHKILIIGPRLWGIVNHRN